MGLLGAENGKVVESWDVCKSKGRKKKKKSEENEGVVEDKKNGCWVGLRLFGSCISSRSKVDSSISGASTHYGNHSFPANVLLLLFMKHKHSSD
jgi:hypothetical protein